MAHFKDLVDFVKKAEQQQKRAAVADGQQLPGEQQWLNVSRMPGPGAVAAGNTRWWALSEEMWLGGSHHNAACNKQTIFIMAS